MKFTRKIKKDIIHHLQHSDMIAVIYGARQVGKSFLVNEIINELYNSDDILRLNGDIISERELFDFTHGQSVEKFLGNKKILFIDEAQRFQNIGLNLKIIYDKKLPIKIIVTGSSSLDIASDIHEPLTGRMIAWTLYPISLEEYYQTTSFPQTSAIVSHAMIYGMYPDMLLSDLSSLIKKIQQLTNNYLYKDILEYSGIRKSEVIVKLLKLLALQIGGEINYEEIGQQLGLNRNTVISYINLLEESFILYRHQSRSSNLRNEIKKSNKIYFRDLGIRNTLLNNFSPLDSRSDIGALRENFVIIERLKYLYNNNHLTNTYFWRSYQQQEIDLVEENQGALSAYEIKYNPNKKGKNHSEKIGAVSFQTITPQNILDFVM